MRRDRFAAAIGVVTTYPLEVGRGHHRSPGRGRPRAEAGPRDGRKASHDPPSPWERPDWSISPALRQRGAMAANIGERHVPAGTRDAPEVVARAAVPAVGDAAMRPRPSEGPAATTHLRGGDRTAPRAAGSGRPRVRRCGQAARAPRCEGPPPAARRSRARPWGVPEVSKRP